MVTAEAGVRGGAGFCIQVVRREDVIDLGILREVLVVPRRPGRTRLFLHLKSVGSYESEL